MRIENSFDVPLSVDDTWRTLLDIPSVAPCIPGVELTDVVDGVFRGIGRVKLGPVQLALKGEASLADVDETVHMATVKGRGRDEKGRGATEASVQFKLVSKAPNVTTVSTVSDIQLSGMIAQYGRASGLISEVAAQIVSQFAANLSRKLGNQAIAKAGAGTDVEPDRTLAANGLSLVSLVSRAVVALIRRRLSAILGKKS
jgi:carbon monoxide dehydrogenase subunit G